MTVAFVAPLPPIRGGISAHSANLLRALRTAGVSTLAISWLRQYPGFLYRKPETQRVAVMEGVERVLHWARPWSWCSVGRRVRQSADLLFVPWVTPFHAPMLKILIRTSEVSSVFLVHNAKPHEWFPATPQLTRTVLNEAKLLIAHSEAVVNDLRTFGVTVPATVIPHPPNIDLVPSPPPSGPPTRLLFAGFIRPYKGLDLLIEALSKLPTEYSLTVAGEFWEGSDDTRKLVSRLNIDERVTLLDDYVPDDELASLLASHHLVVAPYRSATQSGIVPLAFAAGRPVVATSVGGLAEVVSDQVNGVLCEPHAESIAEAIMTATSSYDALAEGAARTQWSWDDIARMIVDQLHTDG